MKTKLVKRHWCDFCNRAGLQARAMAKHEAHCTLNPARACRVCVLLGDGLTDDGMEQKKPLADLIAMLPDPTEFLSDLCWECGPNSPHARLGKALEEFMPAFRLAAGNCPACMMAALRIKKIPVPMADGFDFKSEMSSIFSDRNNMRADEGYY